VLLDGVKPPRGAPLGGVLWLGRTIDRWSGHQGRRGQRGSVDGGGRWGRGRPLKGVQTLGRRTNL
jgi:hypothetical protein